MRCRGCKKTIPPHKQPRAHVERDGEGHVVGTWHDRCWNVEVRKRRQGGPMPGGRYQEDGPSIHSITKTNRDDLDPGELERRRVVEEEYLALRQRQAELAEQRELEPTPTSWEDWRDPEEMDLDELLAETERRRKEAEELFNDEQSRT